MFERPPNHLVHTERTVMGALRSFHTSNYFAWSLSRGNMGPFRSGFRPLRCTELQPVGAFASSSSHWLIDGLRLHEHQLPPLGSYAHHPVRNHEM
jgi:hypothetical protein